MGKCLLIWHLLRHSKDKGIYGPLWSAILFSDNKASVQFLGRPKWRKAAFSHSNGSELRQFTRGKGERSMAIDARHRGKNGEISR